MRKVLVFLTYVLIVMCSCHGDYYDMGDGYIYTNREIAKCLESGLGYTHIEPLIPRKVLNFACDKDYIIAYQKPDRNWFDFEEEDAPKEKVDSLEQLYSKIYDIHDCYWIIIKKSGQRFGPLEKKEFKKQCKKMGIKLIMDPKYESKY